MLNTTERADRPPSLARRARDAVARGLDGDVYHSFKRSRVTVAAFLVTAALVAAALLAPWLAPHDITQPELDDARLPPVGVTDAYGRTGTWNYPLGTDDLGRDLLSAMMSGLRISLGVGFASVILAAVLGTALGLVSGYVGGAVDSLLMRAADVQLTFPALLVALLVNGIVAGVFPRAMQQDLRLFVLVLAIAASEWVSFARTVRGSTLVEKGKEYVQAAQVIGVHPARIMARHVLPNVLGPVFVIGTLSLAIAILTEATLSFVGVGVPVTDPSLGTLIRIGQQYLFSGEWWIVLFPSMLLVVLVLAVNLLGDWLRDALNPKLR